MPFECEPAAAFCCLCRFRPAKAKVERSGSVAARNNLRRWDLFHEAYPRQRRWSGLREGCRRVGSSRTLDLLCRCLRALRVLSAILRLSYGIEQLCIFHAPLLHRAKRVLGDCSKSVRYLWFGRTTRCHEPMQKALWTEPAKEIKKGFSVSTRT